MPPVAFALNVLDVAMPLAFVESVSAFVPEFANVPLAPEDGAENVTDVPDTNTGFPYWSCTVALNGVGNDVLIAVLWLSPPVPKT